MDNAKDCGICIDVEKDTFFSRLMRKEDDGSIGHSSRVYYCTHPGSVPFQWEEEPGKPKIAAATEEEEKEREEVRSISLPPRFLGSPTDNTRRSSSSSASIVPKKNGIAPLFRFMRVQSFIACQTPRQQEHSHECSFRRSNSFYNEFNSKSKANKCMLIGSTPTGCSPFNINKVQCPIPRPSSRSRQNKLRSLVL